MPTFFVIIFCRNIIFLISLAAIKFINLFENFFVTYLRRKDKILIDLYLYLYLIFTFYIYIYISRYFSRVARINVENSAWKIKRH